METYDMYVNEWSDLNRNGFSLRAIARLYGVSHNSVSRILKKYKIIIKEWHTGKFQDITNKKFGLITAIEPLSLSSKGEYYWKCYCDCDLNKELPPILGTDLRRGRKTHCGCNFPRKIDLAGQTFGFLTAIKDSTLRNNGAVWWECICICSEKHLVTYGDLTTGHTKSCGCQRPKGEDHPNWTGGTEVKLFLRGRLKEWKMESLQKHDFKCAISGSKERLEIHHFNKSFIDIFYEVLSLCNLKELSSVGEYSIEELNMLIESFDSLHRKYGLGISITHKLHKKFHSEYGRNCSLEDFENFVLRNVPN